MSAEVMAGGVAKAHCVPHERVHVVSQVPPVGVLHDDGQVLPGQEHLPQLHDVGVGSAQQLVLRAPARPARVASRRRRLRQLVHAKG